MTDRAHAYLSEDCQGGVDGLMHYADVDIGVWCSMRIDTRGPYLSRRYAVVTCLWCLGLVNVDDA